MALKVMMLTTRSCLVYQGLLKLLASLSMHDCLSSRPPVSGLVPGLLDIEGMRRQTVAEGG